MKNAPGNSGLILEEPLLWEKGKKGRNGMSVPESDVPTASLPPGLTGDGPDFPDLSEIDVVRHYTRLSQWNFGVDTGMYPLGSCTMKYNPKINEKQASAPIFTMAHPLLDDEYCQGTLKLIYELQNHLEIPFKVVINEAVNLAKTYGADDSHKFVNGVLDPLCEELRKLEMAR